MYFLGNIYNVYVNENKKTNDAVLWTMSKIDYNKLLKRLWHAQNWPSSNVKCVLLEYDYTEWSHVKKGNPNVIEHMPNSNVLVHHALKNSDFVRVMTKFFEFDNRNVTIYIRQKIGPDGQPNFHRKQLVVMFDAKFPPLPPRNEDEDEESDLTRDT